MKSDLAKVGVVGSNPIARSIFSYAELIDAPPRRVAMRAPCGGSLTAVR